MTLSARRTAFAVCLMLGLLSGCGNPGTADVTPPVAESPSAVEPECPDGFEIHSGQVDAAMGLRAMGIRLVNCGTETLTLDGYPLVVVSDEQGNRLPVTVNLGTTSIEAPGPQPVTLSPGDTAHAAVLWRNRVTTTDGNEILLGVHLEITAAEGWAAQIVTPESPLDLGNTGEIDVTAWAAPVA